MPDRRYIYTVEVDAAQTQAAARQLRAVFEREMAEIYAGPRSGGASAAPAQMAQQTQQEAAGAARELQRLAQMDVSGGVDELNRSLEEARQNYRLLRSEYEQLTHRQDSFVNSQRSARERAIFATNVEEVRKYAGDEAAGAMSRLGRDINIGERGREIKNDQSSDYTEEEWKYAGKYDDVGEKQRLNAAEKQRLLELESQMYGAELRAVRLDQELATRRRQQIESSIEALPQFAAEGDDTGDRLAADLQEAYDQIDALGREETALVQSLNDANGRLAEQMRQQQRETLRKAGEIPAAVGPALSAGTTAYTQQAAITVSKASTENAERLAAALKEAAAASQQMNTALMNADRRSFELDTFRERMKIEGGSRIDTERELSEMRAAEAQKRAESKRTTDLKKQETAQAAQAAKQAAREEAAAAKLAAKEASAAARQAAKEKTQAAREAAKSAKEAERETAQAAKQAAKEIAAANRAATQQQAGRGQFARDLVSRPFGMSWGSLAGGVGAVAGLYGADQLIRGTYDAGRSGAQQMRQQDSFTQFAAQQGRDANALVSAIRRASKETITETDAMGLASQVLAQKFAASRGSIVTDLETLVRFARRASQIYRDESGNFLSVQEVFARLVKFSREGNKELVDQFGLSNAQIAQALGTTVNGLASAAGAADRWKGLMVVLGEEIERLGDAGLSAADKMEQSEARIVASKQRIDKALAGPTEWAMDVGADLTEGAVYGMPKEHQLATADNAKTWQNLTKDLTFWDKDAQAAAGEQVRRLDMMQMATKQVFEALKAGTPRADEFALKMAQIEQAVAATSSVTDDAVTTFAEINNWFQAAGAAAQTLATDAEAAADAISKITPMAETARTSLEQLARQMAAGLTLNVGLNTANPVWQAQAELAGRQRYVPGTGMVAVDPFTTAPTGENLRALGAGTRTDMMANPAAEARRQDMYDTWDLREERRRAEEQAAEAAAREWESAAEKTAREFEAAAEAAAQAFKDSLGKVPGLIGASDVTDEDMEAAKTGVYRDKADERLRQLGAEALNGADTPEDPRDWARRLGMDENADPKAVYAEARRQWEDSSLFAGGKNMDLIRWDVVAADRAQQAAAASGQQAIIDYATNLGMPNQRQIFGRNGEQMTLTMPGMPALPSKDEAATAGQDARDAFMATMTTPAGGEGPSSAQAFLDDLIASLSPDMIAGEAAATLAAVGESILGAIKTGYDQAATNTDWSTPVVESLAAQVAPMVMEMLEDQL